MHVAGDDETEAFDAVGATRRGRTGAPARRWRRHRSRGGHMRSPCLSCRRSSVRHLHEYAHHGQLRPRRLGLSRRCFSPRRAPARPAEPRLGPGERNAGARPAPKMINPWPGSGSARTWCSSTPDVKYVTSRCTLRRRKLERPGPRVRGDHASSKHGGFLGPRPRGAAWRQTLKERSTPVDGLPRPLLWR